MNVNLINYTPKPQRTCAASARLCYSPIGANDLMEDMTDEEVSHLLTKIVDSGHFSVLEHVSFTFAIEGISRVLSHQLVRHRIGSSYSQQSQRYIESNNFEYIIPNKIKDNKVLVRDFIEHIQRSEQLYNHFSEVLIEQGYNKKEAIEEARYILPNAAETKIVVTMNARALYNFFELRCCVRAQEEIRVLAREMLSQVKEVAPLIFKKAGPTCETGKICKEGKLGCGRV